MDTQQTYLVFGATGETGQHFTSLALRAGHHVKVLARTPGKLTSSSPNLEIHHGTVTDPPDLHRLVDGVDAVVAMLGDARAQQTTQINTAFVRKLIPAMRAAGVARFLYQAGGLSAAPGRRLSPALWAVRNTVARSYIGQHEDNEAVMRYLTDDAMDIEWMVHRAGIGSDGPSKGVLERSSRRISIATFIDCASYSYRLLSDPTAIHTCDPSAYRSAAPDTAPADSSRPPRDRPAATSTT